MTRFRDTSAWQLPPWQPSELHEARPSPASSTRPQINFMAGVVCFTSLLKNEGCVVRCTLHTGYSKLKSRILK